MMIDIFDKAKQGVIIATIAWCTAFAHDGLANEVDGARAIIRHDVESIQGTRFFTMLRPGTKEFLEFVRNKFDVTIWSTGMQAYVESIFDFIGIEGFTLWGRAFCKKIENCTEGEPYEKPLRQITEDLTQIAIVDNTPAMFNKCPLNGILIGTWRGDPNDSELQHLACYLDWLSNQKSMQRNHQAWRIETLCMRSY